MSCDRQRLIIAIAALLALGLAGPASSKAARTPEVRTTGATTTAATAPGTWLRHLRGGRLDLAGQKASRKVFVMNAWDWPLIPSIRAANPAAIALVYKDLSSVRSYRGTVENGIDAPQLPTGVGYVDASTHHPEWFLTNARGVRLEWGPWPGCWQMDVGNTGYQQAWLSNVSRELAHVAQRLGGRGWDGVFLDNALTQAEAYHPGTVPRRYPTDHALQRATRSILVAVSSNLRSRGYLTIANIPDGRVFPGLWADWLRLLDGGFEEQFANFSTKRGSDVVWDWGPTGWKAQVDQIAAATRRGKLVLVQTQGKPRHTRTFRYGYASFLLAAGPGAAFGYTNETPWRSAFALKLGAPIGPYRALGSSVYRRDFRAGVVIVNASRATTATVSLGGSYRDGLTPGTGSRTRVTVAPQDATILTRTRKPRRRPASKVKSPDPDRSPRNSRALHVR